MADVEDLVEAVFDIEDIVEEIADPEDLIEDIVANPLMVLFAFTAALAGGVLLLLFLLTLVLLVLAFGSVEVLVLLMLLSVVVLIGSIAAFLYVQTDIPSDIYQKLNTALEQADGQPEKGDSMTEKAAIEELKDKYAGGKLNDYELDQALDEVLTSENPGEVVDGYTESDRERQRER
ncbi:MAG: hypothetical protein ACI9TI_000264 [Natronomonas sp.]|jgi:hypothetical protein